MLTVLRQARRAIFSVRVPCERLHCGQGPGARGMKLFMLQAIKMMSLEESVCTVKRMCRNLWPPKFCISLVRQAKSAHTEGVHLTALARAEVTGGRK